MEKKGEIFNQLAIISDLLENVNLETVSNSVIFELNREEFDKMSDKLSKKTKVRIVEDETTFSLKIGETEFVFSLSKD